MAGLVEVCMIADCIGRRFNRNALHAADAAGIYLRTRDLPGDIVMAYWYPTSEPGHQAGRITVRKGLGDERGRFIAMGLALHVLRHRGPYPYKWSRRGLLGEDWRAETEAQEFADAFLKAEVNLYEPEEVLPDTGELIHLVK